MQKTARFALLALVTMIAIPAGAAHAATRMPIGFFDDSSFRFSPAREQNLTAAAAAGASVVHTTANWATIAATKPADPATAATLPMRSGISTSSSFRQACTGSA